MGFLKMLPRRTLLVGAGLLLAALLVFSSLLAGIGAGRRADALEHRLHILERNTAASLAAINEQLDALPAGAAREYLVRTCGQHIGIYDGSGQVLLELLEVDVRTLPSADRAMLDAGIVLAGEAALRSLTEDYTS